MTRSVDQVPDVALDGFTTSRDGLTAAEVKQRIAAGQVNVVHDHTSRSVGEIVRANVFTLFNGLLAVLFVAIMITGRWQNALFGLVIVGNAAIGIIQEIRAKRTLDHLAVLNEPHVQVIRDGTKVQIDVEELVKDDLVSLAAGAQVPADGVVRSSDGLEIDESLLTGESDPIDKAPGDTVRSGSVVTAGAGLFQALQVGDDAYAAKLAAKARRFTLVHSELMAGTRRLLRWISLILLIVAPLLLWSQFRSVDNKGWQDAVTGAVAAMVGMIPEGLVLLTSLAFGIATVTLARNKTLVQELPAVEGLARVDTVCLDKTGTLTYGDVAFDELRTLGGASQDDVEQALGLFAAEPGGNATTLALAARFTSSTFVETGNVPFSSARKWSGCDTRSHGAWVLGAPEMVLPNPDSDAAKDTRAQANQIASEGRRVMVLAHAPSGFTADERERATLPTGLVPCALVMLAERIREDAKPTLEYFTSQDVQIKVISGDNPRTVGAIAAKVGVPGVHGAEDAFDARNLSDNPEKLAEQVADHSVFGRVTPQQKCAMVEALQARGRTVAMTGDGVNDVLALKEADIGVAMGNGAPATRAVAQIVLLDGKFSHLPKVVAEGRRVIANIERAANLFLVKNVYSLLMVLVVAVTGAAYPLAPIQLTLISATTIGIPGFFLALGPNKQRYIPGFLGRVLRFAVPTGIVTGAAAYAGYALIRRLDPHGGVEAGRTTATIIILIVSLWTLVVLARPLTDWKLGLVAAMAVVIAVVLAVRPIGHGIFLMDVTSLRLGVAGAIGVVGALLVEILARAVRRFSTVLPKVTPAQ